MKALFLGIAVCAGSLGCIGEANQAARANLLKRASYELACPTNKLVVVPLEKQGNGRELTDAVEGCGKRATYVVNAATDRSWVRNGEIEEAAPTPHLAPAPREGQLEPWMSDNAAAESRARQDLDCPSPSGLRLSRIADQKKLIAAGCGREVTYTAMPEGTPAP